MEHTGYRIPLGRGRSRSVLVRPTARDVVQLGIVSTYGNVMEVVDLDRDLHGALALALVLAREDTDRLLLDGLVAEHAAVEARLRAGWARNPHLNGTYEARRRERGLVA